MAGGGNGGGGGKPRLRIASIRILLTQAIVGRMSALGFRIGWILNIPTRSPTPKCPRGARNCDRRAPTKTMIWVVF